MPPPDAKTATACPWTKTSPRSSARSVPTSPCPSPQRGLCKPTAFPPRARIFHPAAPAILSAPPPRSAERAAPSPDSRGTPRPHQLRQRHQFLEQSRQQVQPQCIRPVRESPLGPLMYFHENSVHAYGRPRACQRLDKFRLPPAGCALPARQLHRMRHVKHHRASRLGQDRKRPHIHHQVVISEGHTALRDNYLIVSRLFHFLHGVG